MMHILVKFYCLDLPNESLIFISVDLKNLKPPTMGGLDALLIVSISFKVYLFTVLTFHV